MKKWYQYWQTWLVAILLFFLPTFLLGLVLMWFIAPWSKRAKLTITGFFAFFVFSPLLLYFAFKVFPSIRKPLTPIVTRLPEYTNAQKRAVLSNVFASANRFCFQKGRCASSFEELKTNGYLNEVNIDSTFTYTLTSNGNDCIISTTISNEKASYSCLSGAIFK